MPTVFVNGGAGADELDLTNVPASVNIVLQGGDATGFRGSGSVGFAGIDRLTGSNGLADFLTDGTGASAAAWALDADLTYSDGVNTLAFAAIENLAGGSGADTFTITGVRTANLAGGAGADRFRFNDGAVLTGTIDGGAGTDVLDESASTTAQAVTLTGLGTVDGFAGTEAVVTGGFTGVDVLAAGGTASDILIGLNAAATWETDGTNRYLSTNVLDFSGFENLVGGSAADTFTISGAQTANLAGGVGADLFRFSDGAVLTGRVDGGAETDTLDESASTTARQVTLTGLGPVDGFAGTEAVVTGGFINLDALIGGTGGDTLTGLNASAIWEVDGSNRYSSTNTLDFTAFEHLTGGTETDRFGLTTVPTGLVTGGAGIDILDFTSATGPVDVALQSADVTGFEGAGTVAFAGIDRVIGSRDTRDRLTDNTGAGTTTWTLSSDPTFSDGTHTLQFSRIEDVVGSQDVNVAFGPIADTTARDLTLRFDAGTQDVQLVDSATLALVSSGVIALAADNLVRVRGTAGADVLRIDGSVADAGLAVVFDARAGADELDVSDYSDAVTTVLEKTDADGFSGIGPMAFRGVDRLTGSNLPGETLEDRTDAEAVLWDLDADPTYGDGSQTLAFAGFTMLVGGGGVDTFEISGARAANLVGGIGADVFRFKDAAVLTGTIDGGADTDALDESALATARQATLTALGSVDGFAGAEAGVTGGFTNVDALVGGTAVDTLTGLNAAATWELDGTDRYLGTNVAGFSGFENLVGGSEADTFAISGAQTANLTGGAGTDTFQFANGASLTGTMDGGAAADTLDLTAATTAQTVTLTGLGSTDGFVGIHAAVTSEFTNIDALVGGTATDTLTGLDAAATWTVAGTNTYSSTNTLTFSGVENLGGGSGVDTFTVSGAQTANLKGSTGADLFQFGNGAVLTGTIDGGGGADTVDLSAAITAQAVTLTGLGSTDGSTGTTATVSSGFTNVDALVGGTGSDTLTGLNTDATWEVDGTNRYLDTNQVNFASFENLVGGSGADTFTIGGAQTVSLAGGAGADQFQLDAGAGVTGSIDGGADGDTLDYSAATTGVTVNLATATGTNIAGGLTEVENVTGGTGNDTLTGDSQANVLIGGPGHDTVSGGDGDDTIIVTALAGAVVDGGTGVDIVEVQGTNAADDLEVFNTQITLGSSPADVVTHSAVEVLSVEGLDGADTFTITGMSNANLVGGVGADTFRFNDGAVLTGSVDGGADGDTVDLSAATAARQVTLTGQGTVDGFAGTETTISGGFTNVDTLVGGTGTDTLTGLNAAATWELDGTDRYLSTNPLNVSGFENLVGGSELDTFAIGGAPTANLAGGAGADVFQFANGAGLTGTIDGGGDADTLDFSAAATAQLVTLTGLGSTDGFAGTNTAVSGQFANIDTLRGGTASDTLTGLNTGATWTVAAASVYSSTNSLGVSGFDNLVGGSGADTFAISGAQTANLAGGAGADSFQLANGAGLTGTIDGGGATDTLDLSATTTAQAVTLTGLGGADGFAGTTAAVSGGFSNLDALVGGTGSDTLTGLNTDATWEVDGTNRYLNTNQVSLASFETLVGGSGVDTFTISEAQTADLGGGAGADRFQFLNGASLTGTLDGGASVDTLDYAAVATARQVTLAGLSSSGFSGTEASVSGGFENVDAVVGGTGSDTLTGLNAEATWQFTSTVQYVSTNALGLTAFENFAGGTGNDRFAITVAPAGLLIGGAGIDELDFTTATGPVSVVLEAADATGFQGTGTATFAGIDRATGSSATEDEIKDQTGIPGASFTATTFSDGVHTLTFAAFENLLRSNLFTLAFGPVDDTTALDLNLQFTAATNTVQLVDTVTSAVVSSQVLVAPADDQVKILGTAGANVFRIDASAASAGLNLNFEAGGGEDELVLSGYTNAQTITIQSADADGYRGTGPVTFAGLDRVSGTNTAGDALRDATGAAAGTWEIDGTNRYVGAQTLQFDGIETLEGGSGQDSFTVSGTQAVNLSGGAGADQVIFGDGAALDGTIDGGAGSDTLDQAAFTTARQVLVTGIGTVDGFAGTEAAISGGFTNIETLVGGTASDTLTGRNATAAWDLDGTNQYVSTNTLGFAGFENLVGGSGADSFTLAGAHTANLDSGAGADLFELGEGAALTGTLDGGADGDTLSYAAATTARQVLLTGTGTVDGFAGTEAGVSGGFTNIDAVVGGTGADTLTGLNAAATWELDGSDRYIGTNILGLSAFDTLIGGTGIDTFQINGAQTANLQGGAGADQYVLAGGASLTGTLDGGVDADTLDAAAFTSAVTVNLATATATPITGGISAIENVIAGAGDDTLIGDAQANILVGGPGHDTLSGGDGADTLIVTALAGAVVDGGAGVDTLFVRGGDGADSLNAFDAQVTLGTSAADVVTFANVERLTMEALGADDTIVSNVTTAGPVTTLDGGLGNDSLSAGNADVTWTLTSATSGTAASGATISFTSIEQLQGGQGNDTVVIAFPPPPGPDPAPEPEVEITEDGVEVRPKPDPTNPNPEPINIQNMETVTIDVIATVTVSAIVPITIAVQAGSTIIGPVIGGGISWLFGLGGGLLGGFGALLKPSGPGPGPTPPETKITENRKPDLPPRPTKVEIKNPEDEVKNDPDDEDDDDDDDEEACKAEYTIDAGGASFEAADCINVWNITGANSGTLVSDGIYTKTFTNVGSLIGGSLTDAFILDPGGSLTGSIDGGGVALANTLTAISGERNWTIDGSNAGDVTGIDGGFENVATLIGGTGADHFTLSSGSLSGSITGGVGSNTLQGADVPTSWTIAGPDSGTVAGIGLGFSAIGNLIGGSAADDFALGATGSLSGSIDGGGLALSNTLNGPSAGATWTIDSSNAGSVTRVAGGFSNVGRLVGGAGDDVFNLDGTGSLSGSINGGSGNNTLASTDGVDTVTITGLDAGIIASVTGGFSGIGSIDAGGGNDSLILEAAGRLSGSADGGGGVDTLQGGHTTWQITRANTGTLTDIVRGWLGFENLRGSNADDLFIFSGGNLGGFIDGGGGNNTIQGPDADTSWALTGQNSGTLTSGGVQLAADGFSSIANLVGGSQDDAFDIGAGSLTGSIDGGGAAVINTLQAGNTVNAWTISGQNAGTVTGVGGGFTNIAFLRGGTQDDRFTLAGGRLAGGTIAGGGGSNSIQGPNAAATWTLTAQNRGRIRDQVSNQLLVDNGFSDIANLIGGSADDTFELGTGGLTGSIDGGAAVNHNTLRGPDAVTTWRIDGVDRGSVADSTGNPQIVGGFSQIGNLTGGSQGDTFELDTNGRLSGALDGGVQADDSTRNTLRGPNVQTTWRISGADQGSLTNVADEVLIAGGFSQIGNLTGGSAADTFVLDANGRLSGRLDGGAQADDATRNTLRAPDVASKWTVNGPDAGQLTNAAGDVTVIQAFTQVGNLTGGSEADTFVLASDQAKLTGVLDGGAQANDKTNTLQGPDVATTWTITDVDQGSLTNAADEALIAGGFRQVGNLTGGSAVDVFALVSDQAKLTGTLNGGNERDDNGVPVAINRLQGPDRETRWTITGADRGSLTDANDQTLITNGFSRIGRLIGGTAADRFTLQTGGRLLEGITGAGGGNTLVGLNEATAWTVTATDAGQVSVAPPLEFNGTTVAANRITFANPHGLETGQAVVYRHGAGGADVGGLEEGRRHFVLKVDDNTIELSDDQGPGATAIVLNAAAQGTRHTITPTVEFSQVGNLNAGSGQDVFDLQADGSLPVRSTAAAGPTCCAPKGCGLRPKRSGPSPASTRARSSPGLNWRMVRTASIR